MQKEKNVFNDLDVITEDELYDEEPLITATREDEKPETEEVDEYGEVTAPEDKTMPPMKGSIKMATQKLTVGETSFYYEFADGSRQTITVGEDGVTQANIDDLIREHNREVESNLRNRRVERTKEENDAWVEYAKKNPYVATSTNYFRSMSELVTTGEDETELEDRIPAPVEGETEYVSEACKEVKKLILTLPEDLKEIYILMYDRNYSAAEVGEELGCSKRTAERKHNKLKDFIRECMSI